MNVLTIAGNLGADARMNSVQTQNGPMAVANFRVAVTKRQKGPDGQSQTLWVDCAMWGKRAEALGQYLTKGSKVTVTGEADVDSYEGQNGFVPKLTMRVNDITLQGGNQQGGQQQGGYGGGQGGYQQPQQQQRQQKAPQHQAPAASGGFGAPAPGSFDDFDDEIPF